MHSYLGRTGTKLSSWAHTWCGTPRDESHWSHEVAVTQHIHLQAGWATGIEACKRPRCTGPHKHTDAMWPCGRYWARECHKKLTAYRQTLSCTDSSVPQDLEHGVHAVQSPQENSLTGAACYIQIQYLISQAVLVIQAAVISTTEDGCLLLSWAYLWFVECYGNLIKLQQIRLWYGRFIKCNAMNSEKAILSSVVDKWNVCYQYTQPYFT